MGISSSIGSFAIGYDTIGYITSIILFTSLIGEIVAFFYICCPKGGVLIAATVSLYFSLGCYSFVFFFLRYGLPRLMAIFSLNHHHLSSLYFHIFKFISPLVLARSLLKLNNLQCHFQTWIKEDHRLVHQKTISIYHSLIL